MLEKIRNLIERNIIKEGTLITVKVPVATFGSGSNLKTQDFVIEKIIVKEKNIFYLVDNKGKKLIIPYQFVYKYDGMFTDRFVSSVEIGKRKRGRKRKSEMENYA